MNVFEKNEIINNISSKIINDLAEALQLKYNSNDYKLKKVLTEIKESNAFVINKVDKNPKIYIEDKLTLQYDFNELARDLNCELELLEKIISENIKIIDPCKKFEII